MRFRLGAVLLATGLLTVATKASALTFPVIGGPGLDQGAVCVSGSPCPGSPFLTLVGAAAVTGSVTYDAGPATVDITLTLSQPASFGGVASLLAGTTFSATGIPVLALPLGGGVVNVVQLGLATGLVSPLNLSVPGGASVVANTPAVSGLNCIFGTAADQCGVSFGPGGLTFNSPALGQDYDAFVTFNVNVPEPGTLLLVATGVAALAMRRRRA